jgi:hypothetical protein
MRSGLNHKNEGSLLAEGIILQAVDDIFDDNQREDCIAFFRSKDFATLAEMAGLDRASQARLFDLVRHIIAVSATGYPKEKYTL